MFKRTSSKRIKLNPTQAQQFLAHNTFGGQRSINERHVERLAEKMQDGRFRTASIALAKTPDGSTMLMDGQHTCYAVILAKKTVDANVDEYHCPENTDVGILFNQFEGASRTQAQSVKAYAHVIGCEFPSRISQIIVSAAILLQGNSWQVSSSRDEKVILLSHYQDFGAWLTELMTEDNAKGTIIKDYAFLLRAPIVASMIRQWEASNNDAMFDFWLGVATGANLTRNSPQLALRNFLLSVRIGIANAASLNPIHKTICTSHEVMYKSLRCWNAWANKELMRSIKYSSRYELPEVANPKR